MKMTPVRRCHAAILPILAGAASGKWHTRLCAFAAAHPSDLGSRAASRTLAAIALAAVALAAIAAPAARAQGSRKDDIVFGPAGHPVSGPTITVCAPTATGTPCSPLAAIFTDATLTVPAPNPFQGDGIGNYHFYASPAATYCKSPAPASTACKLFPT